MTNYVLIDPNSLIFTLHENNKDKMEKYLDSILDTVEIEEYSFIQPVISENTLHLLMEKNNYPEWSLLTEQLNKLNISHKYSAKDIMFSLESILKYPTIEKITNITNVLFEVENVKSQTDFIDTYLEELEKLYAYYYLSNLKIGPTYFKSLNNNIIEISGELIELEGESSGIVFPLNITQKLEVITTLEQLLQKINLIEEWVKVVNYKELIQLYLVQNNLHSLTKWSVGKEFHNNFKEHGFTHEETKIKLLLKAISEIVCQTNLQKTHSLRINNKGNSPQRESKLGKALRHDIDLEYHIHYWKKDNRIVLASLVTHNDFSIPER